MFRYIISVWNNIFNKNEPEFTSFVMPVIRSKSNIRIDDIIMSGQPLSKPCHGAFSYKYKGQEIGFTTLTMCLALDVIEPFKEWPYVFIVKNKEQGNIFRDVLICEAFRRGIEIDRKDPGRVILDGAEYDFIARHSLDKWIHGRIFFTDIVNIE